MIIILQLLQPTRKQIGVLSMTVKISGGENRVLELWKCVGYPFIAITLRSTLTGSDDNCLGPMSQIDLFGNLY